MNFVKITVKDQDFQSTSESVFQYENNRKVDRTYNVNLNLVISYTRVNLNQNTTFSIFFYFTREDYVSWNYNSRNAREEAFEILERHIYGYSQELESNVDYSNLD